MKNTKLIALVAVLVVITLVVSIVVATSNDEKVAAKLEQQVADYEKEIAVLNKTLDDLNAGLITATQALEALKEANVKLENWNKASDAMISKIEELEKAYEDFKASKVVYAEDGETVLIDFDDQYDFSYAYGYNTQIDNKVPADAWTYHSAQFSELKNLAILNIYRAASIEDMNTIISNFKKDIAKVPTIRELLLSTIETVNKDGVAYSDYNDLVLASYLYNEIKETNPKMFTAPATLEDKGEQVELAEELEALKEEFKPLVVENFIKLVDELPEVPFLAPSSAKAVEAARNEKKFVDYLYGATEEAKLHTDKWNRKTLYAKHIVTLEAAEARMVVVAQIKAAADLLNETIDTFKTYEFIANRASRDVIVSLENAVIAWETKWVIITEEKDHEWNEELYNLVNRAALAGYEAKLQANVADLKDIAEEFIASVETLGVITHNSKEVLDAVVASYWTYSDKAVAQLLSVADADYVIGYDLGEGVVAAWNNLAKLNSIYTTIMNKIDGINKAITAITKLVCVQTVHHDVDKDGNVVEIPTCNCTDAMKDRVLDETKYTLGGSTMDTTLADIEDKIVELLHFEGEDVSGINQELLGLYKTARIGHYVANAKANVETARAAAVANGFNEAEALEIATVLNDRIDVRAKNDYTFTLECTATHKDPVTGKDLACDCRENGKLTLVVDATTKSILDFDQTTCNGMFVTEQPLQ